MMGRLCGPLTSRSDGLSRRGTTATETTQGNWRAWGQGPLALGFDGAPVRPAMIWVSLQTYQRATSSLGKSEGHIGVVCSEAGYGPTRGPCQTRAQWRAEGHVWGHGAAWTDGTALRWNTGMGRGGGARGRPIGPNRWCGGQATF